MVPTKPDVVYVFKLSQRGRKATDDPSPSREWKTGAWIHYLFFSPEGTLLPTLCSAKLFAVKLLNIQKDAVCAGLDRTPIRRINGKNTILDVATSERNANEETQYCFAQLWCYITIKLYQRNVLRDRGTQSSGNKKQGKENSCGSEIEEDMNMYLHLFRSCKLKQDVGLSLGKVNILKYFNKQENVIYVCYNIWSNLRWI